MQKLFYIGLVLFTLTQNVFGTSQESEGTKTDGKLKNDKARKIKLPPCRACKIFVDSFQKGVDRTSKFKYEGGDTAWEEKNLGSYANSEIRFVEIHEKLCSEVTEGKDQCYQLLEEYDEALETWWFKKQKDEPDLHKHLCIDKFELCCPEFHFGKNCTPCEGYPDNICYNNGKCKGSGTRKGNGKCLCDAGYSGDYCDSCTDGHYESYRDEKKILCSKCHKSCAGKCSKEGPAGCEICKEGYLQNKDRACYDINECLMGKSPCTNKQFCVNTDGGYTCLECHESCLGCTGDGPDECISCVSGYRKKDNMCINTKDEARTSYASLTRYLTYFGLCLCTCIILQKNLSIAAVVGLCVGVYITLSEYIANTSDSSRDDFKEQLADQLQKALQGQ